MLLGRAASALIALAEALASIAVLVVMASLGIVALIAVLSFLAVLGSDRMYMLGLMFVVFAPILLLILTGVAAMESRHRKRANHYDKSELTSLGLED